MKPIELSSQDIHLWLIDEKNVEAADVLRLYPAILSPDENKHMAAFTSSCAKRQYLITRCAVRLILAKYLEQSCAQALRFSKNQFSKPELADNATGIHFNISHSAGRVLIGITRNRGLGVDIEYMGERGRKKRDTKKMAKHYYHPNELPPCLCDKEDDAKKHFYQIWTLKEAFVKAQGKGLFMPANEFFFESFDEKYFRVALDCAHQYELDTWVLEHAFIKNEFSLAVAWEHLSDSDTGANKPKILSREYVPMREHSIIDLL